MAGNALDTTAALPDETTVTVNAPPDPTPDTTPPTLTSIDDGDADDTVTAGDTLTYTVTFSEDIDGSTVTAADFSNGGTANITIGTITETSPGVFSVQVTADTAGSLILQIPAGANIEDVAGNALDTTAALPDDTTVTVNAPPDPTPDPNPSGQFNYAEALQKSYLFYEAQRSGPLPDDNRIPWRGDSALEDGNDVGRDLTGGYYDAGDHVKFGLPMAASMTMLAWGIDEYNDAYQTIGQLDEALGAIKWGTDYLLKAYDDGGTADPADDVFYGQVGNGQLDHAFWGPPEIMTMERPTYQINAQSPGSDLAGESAAALASASIIFRSAGDQAYADQLLEQAEKLYDFAETYQGKYSDSITDASNFYNSWSGYTDELAWGATWLHKATEAAGQTDTQYLAKAEQYYQDTNGIQYAPWTQNWDDKKYGTAILLAQETGDTQYQVQVEAWLDRWMIDKSNGGIPTYTEGGLAWLDQWGALRYTANTAMLAGIYADTVNDQGGQYSQFAEDQIDYILGENPNARSYVVGFGENSPQNPHHRGAHGSLTNDIYDGETKNVLYGALVGGPKSPDDNDYADERDDYIANEVALDYNAGFTGALAYLVDKHGGTPLPDDQIPMLFPENTSPPSLL